MKKSLPRKNGKAAGLALVPGMAHPNKLVVDGKRVPTAVQQSIVAYEAALGGRKALIEQLSSGDHSEEVQQVLTIIADPRFDRWTLAKICAHAGISPGQLFQAFRHAAIARAQVFAMVAVADAVPRITADLLAEAIAHTAICTACNGEGTKINEPTAKVPEPQPYKCSACQGLGKIHVPADLERQKLALEMANILKKAGGIAIQNNMVAPAAPTTRGGSLEQLQQAIGEIMYGARGREDLPTPELDPTPDTDIPPPLEGEVV